MMTGNMQGYEDINNQRLLENNYKFSWSEEMMEDLEQKITDLGGEEPDQSEDSEDNSVEFEERLISLVPEQLDIYEGGDVRQRPSSLHSKTSEGDNVLDDQGDSDHTYEASDDSTSKDEL